MNSPAYLRTPYKATCPACESEDCELLYEVSSSDSARHFLLAESSAARDELRDVIEELWDGKTASVVSCRSCALGFADPLVAGDYRFYNLAYPHSGYPGVRWEHRVTAAYLEKRGMKDFKILEVGAGDGSFMGQVVPNLTTPEQVFCFEHAEQAAEILEGHGYTRWGGDIRDGDAPIATGFDVVAAFQVVEHLDRLEELFQRVWEMTASEGLWFISVPQESNVSLMEQCGGFIDMPPNHLTRWTLDAFEALAKRTGWKIIESENDSSSGVLLSLKSLLVGHYHRKATREGSWRNWIEQKPKGLLRTGLRVLAMIPTALQTLPSWPKFFGRKEGDVIWVVLEKQDADSS